MTLSMQEWQGWKHPSIPLFAAFTMEPHLRVVMSPLQRYSSSFIGSRPSMSVIPFTSVSLLRYASWMLRNSALIGSGGRTFISDRRSLRCSVSSAGMPIPAYLGLSASSMRMSSVLLSS